MMKQNGNGNNSNGNSKCCPMCGKSIFDWECLCGKDWVEVKRHDAMYGTHYIEDFLAGKKPVFGTNDSMAEQIKWIKNKRRIMLRDLCTELCRRCTRIENERTLPTTTKDPDTCKTCQWYRYMNYLLSEYEGLE